jgi:hypothetical protein
MREWAVRTLRWGDFRKVSTDVRIGPPGDMRKGSPVQFSVIAAYNPWWSISSVG